MIFTTLEIDFYHRGKLIFITVEIHAFTTVEIDFYYRGKFIFYPFGIFIFMWAPVPDLNVLASQDEHMLQGLITLHLVGSTLSLGKRDVRWCALLKTSLQYCNRDDVIMHSPVITRS